MVLLSANGSLSFRNRGTSKFSRFFAKLNCRLAEYAFDGTTVETDGALTGEPASTALADSSSSRFSLFDDAGIGPADALVTEFEGSISTERRVASSDSTLEWDER